MQKQQQQQLLIRLFCLDHRLGNISNIRHIASVRPSRRALQSIDDVSVASVNYRLTHQISTKHLDTNIPIEAEPQKSEIPEVSFLAPNYLSCFVIHLFSFKRNESIW